MNTLSSEGLFIDKALLGEEMLLVKVVPYYEYIDKRRTENIVGYKYIVVLPGHGYEKLDVKIPGKKLLEVQLGQSLSVRFNSLRVKPYVSFGAARPSLQFTASAEGITPKR